MITELGNGALIFHHGTGALLNMEGKTRGGSFGPTSTEYDNPLVTSTGEVALWGTNNLRPQEVVAELEKSDLLRPLIHKWAKRLIGQGLLYGTSEVDEFGEEKRRVMQVLEIDQVLRRTNINLFLLESAIEYKTHGNAFAELQTDYDGKVVGLFNQECTRVRLSRKEKKTGQIKYAYLSGKWANGASTSSEDTITVPALDPYYDPAGQVMRSKSGRFIMPLRVLLDDADYYAKGDWHGLIDGGYLELAKAIIKTKLYLTVNLAHIKYHVEVGKEWWELTYPGFGKMKPEEQKRKRQDVIDAFTKWVTGQEKAGRTMLTDMLIDELAVPGKKEYRSLWKITAFKLDIPTGAYVEDSAEVDAKIIRAFMDMSLFGQTPSKDRNSSGSGSDKRVAHSIEVMDSQVDASILLSPLDVMADTQGWHEKYGNGKLLKFWFKSLHVATADKTAGMVYQKDPNTPTPPKA